MTRPSRVRRQLISCAEAIVAAGVGPDLDLEAIFRNWKLVLGTQEKYQINNPGRIAELTSRMVGACFRKGPRSWTAALSALEFFGFAPAAFVSTTPAGVKAPFPPRVRLPALPAAWLIPPLAGAGARTRVRVPERVGAHASVRVRVRAGR